jgi:hypothetical protein
MSIYGENDLEFLPRPPRWRLGAVAFSAAAIGAVAAPLLVSLMLTAAAALLSGSEGVVLYAPLASPHALPMHLPPLQATLFDRISGSVPLLALAASLVALSLWPTSQRLAARLMSLGLATNLAVYAAATAPAAGRLLPGASPASASGLQVVAILAAAWLVLRAERRTVELTASFHALVEPRRRLALWGLRIPLPYALLAALALANGSRLAGWSYLAVLLVTLLENLAREPKQSYERLDRVQLKEAAAILPLTAAIAVASALWLFGSRAAGPGARVVVWKLPGEVALAPLDSIPRFSALAPQPGSAEEPVIDIRWSKQRDGDGTPADSP